uniref:phosphoinositide phosphatase SAC2-like isoform X2 n=1 Tax=Erigeron canadensis TaxID=72917 RepID=UPI001CB89A32|nr:phosphoinositide phosphatase SAC2-like isoform X2 [Erigeron canadensis]
MDSDSSSSCSHSVTTTSTTTKTYDTPPYHLHKSRLYETPSNYYIIGSSKNKSVWRVLKIDRSEASELNIVQDSTVYTEPQCAELIHRINVGNKSTGGIKLVTLCYGIVGFINFLGPYYMLLITKRRKIGAICGHVVYAIAESKIFPIPNSTIAPNVDHSKNENRYMKLLSSVNLTKDFFFSYSYHVMHSLQKNLSAQEAGQGANETMFVWNEFLTSAIHNQLNNNIWTVALVYGFFKQVKLLISGKEFHLTLIARRSRHYAGTRYLKRGVNENGCVANDVETEQIVFEDVPEGSPVQVSSIVQNRGSIPLFWSQETSRLKVKPDIILSKKDQNYDATRLHFQNLYNRYGNPVIILNLVKTREKKPRESLLRVEFANAIESINRDLPRESRLKFLHWDLNKYSRKSTNVLALLGKVATYALDLTGFFYCRVTPSRKSQKLSNQSENGSGGDHCLQNCGTENSDGDILYNVFSVDSNNESRKLSSKPPKYQTGVLRTNCIDCLDRTNVAQYAYGWAALGHQLHALGYLDVPTIGLDSPLADNLMEVYEKMGDTLALQYGGSAAHNKIFSQRRGQWKAATQSQEFFRTIQRYYSNAYMDAQKQDAINVFLGHYRPQHGRPALWELDSDRHYVVGNGGSSSFEENARSLSDGNIISDATSPMDRGQRNGESEHSYHEGQDSRKGLSESSPEISTCESDSSYPRYMPAMSRQQLFLDAHAEDYPNSDRIFYNKRLDSFNCSNFLDVDMISSSGNSCEEEPYERSLLTGSPCGGQSSENLVNGTGPLPCGSESCLHLKEENQGGRNLRAGEYPDEFVKWVMDGGLLFH